MTSPVKKRVKIVYLFCNLHNLKCKEKHLQVGRGLRPHARAACASLAPGGRGLQPHASAARDPDPRWAGGTPAACQTSVRATLAPGGQRGLRPRVRAAHMNPTPGPQLAGGAPAARQSGACVPGPWWAGGLQPRARAARVPQAPGYLVRNLHTLKCKENIYLE